MRVTMNSALMDKVDSALADDLAIAELPPSLRAALST
jgi:hypothetical protein